MHTSRLKKTREYQRGADTMKKSSVSICSIVRDCQTNLKRNRSRIELLRSFFRESEVIIFENDSKDNTREIHLDWQTHSNNVNIFSETYGGVTIPAKNKSTGNRYFSISRIEKMARYRNQYIDFLNKENSNRDYVIIIDLDISNFDIEGIVHSFGLTDQWDCISANGKSLSSNFRQQYHDSYALIEFGKINSVQTEDSIYMNQFRFSFLRPGMPLFPVDSAYGGIAIFLWSSLKGLRYSALKNEDDKVESKSEHVSIYKKMKENGNSRIFINPSMILKYRTISIKFLISKVIEKVF